MGEEESAPRKKPELNLATALAGGLAALTSAVLLSFTGTNGTILGAALGSTVLTLGNSVYEYYLRRVAELRAIAHQRMLARISRGERLIVPDERPAWPSPKDVLTRIPYRRVLLTTATLFAVVMTVIVSLEMAAGRSVAAMAGASNARTTLPLPGVERTIPPAPSEPELSPSEPSEPAETPSVTEEPTETAEPSSEPPAATIEPSETDEPLDDAVSPEPTLLEPSITVPTMTDETTAPAEEPTEPEITEVPEEPEPTTEPEPEVEPEPTTQEAPPTEPS